MVNHPRPIPAAIDLIADRDVVITWSDGSTTCHPAAALRARCPCATCGQETGGPNAHAPIKLGEPLPLMPAKARTDVTIRDVEAIGHYAIRFTFSDGHDTGIYSYEMLREMNPPG
ncbi:MAG TPA: DUF971 domain-containing protein [Candidatus Eisenbacteria bacterium]